MLLQLFMWYFVLNELLPPIAEALHPLPGIFLSKSGMSFPVPEWEQGHLVTLGGSGARASSARGSIGAGRAAPSSAPAWRGRCSGRRWRSSSPAALLGWLAGGAPTALEMPERNDLNVVGGGAVTPEFLAVPIGLTIYTASFVAEIVRGGHPGGGRGARPRPPPRSGCRAGRR